MRYGHDIIPPLFYHTPCFHLLDRDRALEHLKGPFLHGAEAHKAGGNNKKGKPFLLTFRGKRYTTGLGAVRSAFVGINNGDDVIYDTHCMGNLKGPSCVEEEERYKRNQKLYVKLYLIL